MANISAECDALAADTIASFSQLRDALWDKYVKPEDSLHSGLRYWDEADSRSDVMLTLVRKEKNDYEDAQLVQKRLERVSSLWQRYVGVAVLNDHPCKRRDRGCAAFHGFQSLREWDASVYKIDNKPQRMRGVVSD
jgi:hypothetical protein